MTDLSLLDKWRSLWNAFWFFVRRTLRFQRSGYSESTEISPTFSPEALRVNEDYQFTLTGKRLAPHHWHRNLATIWYLEQMFAGVALAKDLKVLEPGSQNFSRLPSLRAFFGKQNGNVQITGIELDAFVPIKGFYSLWDHAQYYISLKNDNAQFIAGDFFKFVEPADVIVCFYPFVSAEPALAWGLPAAVAGADKWIRAFLRNLKLNGYVFVVHQGDWEEEDFDRAREGTQLELVHRQVLVCPFFSTKHPVHASLYKKGRLPHGES